MSAPFAAKHGVALETILFCVGALSIFSIMTFEGLLLKDDARRSRVLVHQTNLRFRGYWMINLSIDDVATNLHAASPRLGFKEIPPEAEILTGLRFLTRTPDSAKSIALWSGGKRPILLPLPGGGHMVDLAAIVPFLNRLFVGASRDGAGDAKGSQFESAVRETLRSLGANVVHVGKLQWSSGEQHEVDAAMRVGDRLVLLECVSIEQPLDLELGKPPAIEKRKELLEPKLRQARSLADAIVANPTGGNFDFSWARTVDWRVVSPSVEFTWDLSDDYFDEAGVPRVLAVSELEAFIAERPILESSVIDVLRRARRTNRMSS